MNKLVLVLGALILLTATSSLFGRKGTKVDITPEVMEQFQNWKNQQNKIYKSEDEEIYRMEIFAINLNMINKNNAQNNGVTMKINALADLSTQEFSSIYLGTIPEDLADGTTIDEGSLENLGDVDWRTKGAVQKVKNQGQCGSCWAFSAAAVTESAYAVFKSQLGDFSEQQLVDCSRKQGNQGCNGGWPSWALQYISSVGGFVDESKYPYTARDGTCKVTSGNYPIKGQSSSKTCDGLKSALDKQPISVCVDASNWQFYSSGVFSNCGTGINHAVLAAGYTSDYWIIKNSWGSSWGEQGYIRLKTGNTCAVCNVAVWPSV